MTAKKSVNKLNIKGSIIKHDASFYEILRPKPVVDTKTNLTVALLIFFTSLIVYWITQNRSVTFWDVGEYIACSSILGIPHPPGNPFYIVLGRFFCILGFGTPHALVINSISGLMSALAVMFTYLFTVKLVSMFEENKTLVIITGIIAALYNAYSFTFWNNAVEASVYPGRDLVINSVIYLTLVWAEKSRNFSHQNLLLLIIYIFFIGFSIHQTALQIVPAVLLIVLYPFLLDIIKTGNFWVRAFLYFVILLALYFSFIEVGKQYHIPDMAKIVAGSFFALITYIHLRDKVEGKAWLLALLFVFIGISSHFYLFVRSELRPFINEGHPHNLEMFSDYVLRRQYGVTSFMQRRATAFYQFNHHFMRYFFWQFFHPETISGWTKIPAVTLALFSKIIVLFLGFFGIYHQAKKNKHSFIYLLAFFFMTCFAMIFVMNLSDGEVRDRDYFFVSAYYLWGVWMAIGSLGLIRMLLPKLKQAATVAMILLIALPVINFASQFFIHNRSKEFIALDYGINFLNSVEENAIIFTNGDNDTFPLWYAQAVYDPNAVEHIHPASGIYPDREAEEAIKRAMEIKTAEIKGIRPDVTIANLSLLNTPWYIRHLRDIEGVLFDIPDEMIDNIRPQRNDRELSVTISSPNNEESFMVTIPNRKLMLIKDIAAIRIIRNNFGRRPLYMAVTVADEIVFQDHLRNEGKVNRIVSTKGKDQVNIERLRDNVDNVYSYRSIFDKNVYKDENMQKLIMNYGAAHMRVSQYYNRRGDVARSAEYLASAVSFIRDNSLYHPAVVNQFILAKNEERALEYIDDILTKEPDHIVMYLEAIKIHLRRNDTDMIFEVFNRAIANRLISVEILQYVTSVSQQYDEYERGIDVLRRIRRYDRNPIIDDYILRLQEHLNKSGGV